MEHFGIKRGTIKNYTRTVSGYQTVPGKQAGLSVSTHYTWRKSGIHSVTQVIPVGKLTTAARMDKIPAQCGLYLNNFDPEWSC